MFPEATISRSFTVKDFKSGAARMARTTEVPLLPMALWGGPAALDEGAAEAPDPAPRPGLVYVGEPMHPQRRDDPIAGAAELRGRMQALLDRAQKDYPASPAGPDDRWWLPAHLGGTAPPPEDAFRLDSADGSVA